MVVDADLHPLASQMTVLYRSGSGSTAAIPVSTAFNGTRNVRLSLGAHEVVVLQ
ncbi:MAG TPA: hypothetical protein VGL13_07250 [Polyangiaceae bacterium]